MKFGSYELTDNEIRYRVPRILTPNELKDDLRSILDLISGNTIVNVFIDVSEAKTVISDGLDTLKLMVKAITLSGANPILLSVPSQFAPIFSNFLSETNVKFYKSYQHYLDRDKIAQSEDYLLLKDHFKNELSKESQQISEHVKNDNSASTQMYNQLLEIENKKNVDFAKFVNDKEKKKSNDFFNL